MKKSERCTVKNCDKAKYKDGDMCRIHQSEVRMFGKVRDKSERTAKTVGNVGALKSLEYSNLTKNLKEQSLEITLETNKKKNERKFYRRFALWPICDAEGCHMRANPKHALKHKGAKKYCFHHKHLHQYRRSANNEALHAIAAVERRKREIAGR